MMNMKRYLSLLLGSIFLMLLMVSCSQEETDTKQPTVLTIYVYPPERPVATRAADTGVEGLEEENKVSKLQIWVFEHETGNRVSYLDADVSKLDASHSAAYELIMPEWFIIQKPNVDVYVFANVTTGTTGVAYGESDSRETLDNATLNNNFGLTSPNYPVINLPADGIPMTGVLQDQPIGGEAPRLYIGSGSGTVNTKLVRTTSKLLFIFGRPVNGPKLTITDISIDAGMIPNIEYLVAPPPLTCRVGTSYNSSKTQVIDAIIPVTTSCPTPSSYVFDQEDAEDYDARIQEGIANGELTKKGPFYLRESDKRITGTLSYRVDDGAVSTATFAMANAGDFVRNRSWIVYAYYTSGNILTITTVDVDDWEETPPIDHSIHNW